MRVTEREDSAPLSTHPLSTPRVRVAFEVKTEREPKHRDMNQTDTPFEIVLLNGNMCDARLWQGGDGVILKALRTFAPVGIIDFKDDATIEAMAMRVLNACTGPILPIGFSMGGIVALEIARRAVDRVAGLALIDTTSCADTRGPERLRQQEDIRAGHLERVVIEELKPNYLAACHRGDQDMLDLLRAMAVELGPEVFIAQSEALRTRADLTPVLASLYMPVLVACGREDGLCPPDLHQAMAQTIPNATFVCVDQAGHLLPLEQPHVFAQTLTTFLNGLKD
jgi:pimeloyl-ACP methyl ester carboxylesterase